MSIQAPVPGQWYWGAACPLCGQRVPIFHDPSAGKSDIRVEAPVSEQPYVSLRCSRNHAFDAPVERLERFEYRA